MSALLTPPVQTISPLSAEHLERLDYETPFLAMSLSSLEERYYQLVDAFPGIQLHYAMKCNPAKEVLKRLHSLGCRFEIASFPELEMLLEVGVDPLTVLFSNPVKPSSHIAAAYKAGLRHFSFDSVSEINKLVEHAPNSQVYARLGIDNPCSEVPSEGKFGISPSQVIELMLEAKARGLQPTGLAFHVGSQMLSPLPWTYAIEKCGAIMRELESHGVRLDFLDIGGGFPAHYGNYDPDFQEFGQAIENALKEHLPYEVNLVAEPGRALVAEAGVMVSTIIGKAQRNGKDWIHLDVGAFNGMMEALETQNKLSFPLEDSKSVDSKNCQQKPYHITGPSCDSQDTILFNALLSENLEVGDQVYLYSCGAYTTSYASNFNGFDIPKIHYVD